MTITQPDTDVLPHDAEEHEAVLAHAMRLLSRHPLHEISLQMVADAAGLPVSVVEGRFPAMHDLLVAAIEEWNVRRSADARPIAATHGTVAYLRRLLSMGLTDPSFSRAVLSAASIAGAPGHEAAESLRHLWMRFHAGVQRALAEDIAAGREPDTMDPARGAEQLLALYEGLQFQWLLRPSMDLLGSFDRAATRLRRGWSEEYVAPLWVI